MAGARGRGGVHSPGGGRRSVPGRSAAAPTMARDAFARAGVSAMTTALHVELAALDHGSHLCLVYETAAEQVRAAVPFIVGGLARGECCIYIVDEHTAAEL